MMVHVIGYLTALGFFVLADMAWLGVMVKRVYRPAMGDIALADANIAAAVVFYLLYPVGLMIFAILPAVKNGEVTTALWYGALFGFFTYATYDLTNLATLRNWTTSLTLVDMAWGTVLAACTAAVSHWVMHRFGG